MATTYTRHISFVISTSYGDTTKHNMKFNTTGLDKLVDTIRNEWKRFNEYNLEFKKTFKSFL